jgi:hypothetical protein
MDPSKIILADTTEIVSKAHELYKKYFSSINYSFKAFDGNRNDIDVLDYCIYEQLGFPEEDYYYASFIWGNVIQQNSKLTWGTMEDGQYVLYYDDDFRYVIFSQIRVIEAILNSVPQFEKFNQLTEKTVMEMSQFYVDLINSDF